MTKFDEALSYLLSLGHETLTIKLGLKNTETLLDALGNPQKNLPAVQIAGTNGKGSTAVMLDAICSAAGIRTGLFTSPHLLSITERLRIDGAQISEAQFARIVMPVKHTAESLVQNGKLAAVPTFFEHVTAIALLAFAEAKVDLAILETGLGGRLDSTTAAGAAVIALTPIAMDHQEYLGNTLAQIAAEKAAILRPGVRAIVGPQRREALGVIMQRCEDIAVEPRLVRQPEHGELPTSMLRHVDIIPKIIGTCEAGRCFTTFKTKEGRYENVLIGLRGRHQVTNAAIAVALAEELREQGSAVSAEAIKRGLETVRHAGRLEMWETKPPILFDGAHNPSAAEALRSYLDEFVTQPITMIFGAMRDKALDEMASILWPAADELILTEIDNPRSASIETLKSIAGQANTNCRKHFASSPADALRIARSVTASEGLICITGSLYLVGAMQHFAGTSELESVSARA
jgi:dihydrofolate synthase/folylpolyglutamate synthase